MHGEVGMGCNCTYLKLDARSRWEACFMLWPFFIDECAAITSFKEGSRFCVDVRAKINIPSATENRLHVIQSLSHCTGWATQDNIFQDYRVYVFFFKRFYLKPEVFRDMTLCHGRAVSTVSKEKTWVFRNTAMGILNLVTHCLFSFLITEV